MYMLVLLRVALYILLLIHAIINVGAGRPSQVYKEDEEVLVNYIEFMAKSGHPLSIAQIKAFAWAIDRQYNNESRYNFYGFFLLFSRSGFCICTKINICITDSYCII